MDIPVELVGHHACASPQPHAIDPDEALAARLADDGLAVADGWLPPDVCDALAAEARALLAAGAMRPARIGRGPTSAARPEIRGDHITWLEDHPHTAARTALNAALERLRLAINRATMLGLFDHEGHFAAYPPGTGYATHLDRHRDDDARLVSCILYLNRDWTPDLGGALRVHRSDAPPLDVLPTAGRLAVFLSDRTLHEVRPAHALRLSVVGWFRRRRGLPTSTSTKEA